MPSVAAAYLVRAAAVHLLAVRRLAVRRSAVGLSCLSSSQRRRSVTPLSLQSYYCGNKNSVTNVLACEARNADDKIIQHNGFGHVNINGFYGENFGKLYRSCGTCGSGIKRTMALNHVWGNPKMSLVTVNGNNRDVATFTNDIHVHSSMGAAAVCQTATSMNGKEPKITSKGASKNCVFNQNKIEFY